MMARSRRPAIMADCAQIILRRDKSGCTGNFFIDDELLASEGITDLTSYAVDPELADELMPDFFV